MLSKTKTEFSLTRIVYQSDQSAWLVEFASFDAKRRTEALKDYEIFPYHSLVNASCGIKIEKSGKQIDLGMKDLTDTKKN